MPRTLLILLVIAVAAAGCDTRGPTAPADDLPGGAPPQVVKPTVSTVPVTAITITRARAGGEVRADGGAPVTARGVTWSTASNPTISDYRTSDGAGTGTFISEMGGLSPGGTYYVRAFATNSAGTAYGEEVSFTTEESEYAIIVLGRVDGYPTLGNALNEQCHIAGSYHRGSNRFGTYVWAPGTGIRAIGGPAEASGFGIAEEGTVVGVLAVPGDDRAYSWSEAGGFRLHAPPAGAGFTSSAAAAINSHGTIAGSIWAHGPSGTTEMAAALWRPDGGVIVLRNPLGGLALTRAINDDGVAVGYAGSWGSHHATAWRAHDEDPLILAGGLEGQAWGINNWGDIVGVVGPQAALWRGGQRTLLPALPGHGAATARALTERVTVLGADAVIRVVGWSEPTWWGPAGQRRPVVWTVDRSDVEVAELYPPAGHLGAFAKAVRIIKGEVVVVGTSYTHDSAFAVMWTTSRDVCGS
jgi:hypothetical protein